MSLSTIPKKLSGLPCRRKSKQVQQALAQQTAKQLALDFRRPLLLSLTQKRGLSYVSS
jgi:hypothetical protein